MKTLDKSIIGVMITAVVLLAYVSFLLTTNYTSQANLQQSILEQFRSESAWRSTLVTRFFSDRREDMQNLASSREITVFYENRALGMSMAYGLRQSLPPIKERFIAMLNHNRIEEETVYQQIALLDEKGELLVRASAPRGDVHLLTDMKQLREPGYRNSALIADDHTGAILISTAYFFKGTYAGQIIAWINPDYITRHIILSQGAPERKTILVENTKRITFPSISWPVSDVMDRSKGLPIRLDEKDQERTQRSMIGLSIPVQNTPFSLVTVAPTSAILGKNDPHGLLFGMGILAIVIISGGIFLVRAMTRSLLLRTRLNASLEHANEMREKNLQLEKEVAERRQTEEELRESEEKFALFMDYLPAIVFIKDGEGRTLFVNKYMKDNLGAHDWIGKTTGDLFPQHIAESMIADDEKTMSSGYHMIVEHVPHVDGTGHIYQTQKFVVTRAGKAPLLAGLALDITERKRAEEEKTALEEERQKTQKLEAIGTLAGGIAHDFNNLLQGVFGYISLAKLKKDDTTKCLTALDNAEKALHLSVKLTNQLLTFSKGGKPVKRLIDIHPVIKNAAKFALSGSHTDFRVIADKDLWSIDADEGQIGQVIQNIVLNADQAMPDGGHMEITVRNTNEQEGALPQGLQKDNYIVISIKDEGVGIPTQYLGRIFDPYFTTKEKGSGLGLATSYSIIKNHDGVINVKSEVGEGTTFSIYLPATSAISSDVQGMPAIAATAGHSGRVLVMDDEEIVRDVAGALIEQLGHRVESAAHGKEALEKYQEAKSSGDPFDVVILDLTIKGGMGGAETFQMLSKIDPNVKAVVSSGYSDDASSSGHLEHGFKAILKKPYDVAQLRETLNRLLNT